MVRASAVSHLSGALANCWPVKCQNIAFFLSGKFNQRLFRVFDLKPRIIYAAEKKIIIVCINF
jgi:hypothetical protein